MNLVLLTNKQLARNLLFRVVVSPEVQQQFSHNAHKLWDWLEYTDVLLPHTVRFNPRPATVTFDSQFCITCKQFFNNYSSNPISFGCPVCKTTCPYQYQYLWRLVEFWNVEAQEELISWLKNYQYYQVTY